MTMYVNMNSEKLTVPLKTDGKPAFHLSQNSRNKLRNILIFTSVSIFVVINILLVVFTALTIARVKNLENEVSFLKKSVYELEMQGEILNSIVDLEDEDYEENLDQGDPHIIPVVPPDDYDEFEYYYDQFNDSKVLDDNIEDHKLAMNLTKEGRETSRTKRNIVAATEDGVVINSESYAERKAKNGTRRKHIVRGHSTRMQVPARASSIGSAPQDSMQGSSMEDSSYVVGRTLPHNTMSPKRTTPSVYIRQSRVMHHEDKSKAFRQVVKKSSLKSGDMYSEESTTGPGFTIVRDYGTRRSRMGRVKLPAIHYNGDTSKYVLGQHTNFNGNGHLRHPHGNFVDWKVSDWATSAGMDDYFTMQEGVLTVKESGIYFIYAQIYYLDEHDTTGFRVYKNSETVLLQCTTTIHAREKALIGNTCYTGGIEYLSGDDTITLSDITRGRYSLFEPGKSFFGLIKLSDVRIR